MIGWAVSSLKMKHTFTKVMLYKLSKYNKLDLLIRYKCSDVLFSLFMIAMI